MAQLRILKDAVPESTKTTAHTTDAHVDENPWQTVGIAAGFGATVGVVFGLMFCRR